MPAQRQLGHVTDQESMVRADCREAPGGAAARELVQRQRPADLYGFPQEALAKILQRLARAGLLLSHHGIKGRYTLARDPRQISVLDVIKASEEAPRDAIDGKHGRHLESVPGYHRPHMVSQIVEDALCRVRIADIEEQASSPTDSYDARRC